MMTNYMGSRWLTMIIVKGFTFLAVASSGAAADRPNIVLIYTDDQGFGDASCLNPQAKFQTPNLDRLAMQGIRFTNAHCADTVCTPSRYGLLTGRYCWRTRLKTGVFGAEAECLIPDGRETLATLLRGAGYQTAMVGKWHLGMDFPGDKGNRDWTQPVRDMPLDKGFDYFFGVPASLNYGVLAWFEGRYAAVPPTLYTAKKPNNRHSDYRIRPPYQATPQATRDQLGTVGFEVAADFVDNQCLMRFTDKAIDWMASKASLARQGTPFFLYLPYTSPHYPVCPLPEFHGRGECGGYGEFVVETDHHVGRILDFLEESGLEQDTLVIFTSDNGPENSWRKRIDDFGHYSSGPYRGGKRDIYEGGHRVPFFVRWPSGIVEPGRVCESLVGQVDIYATIAEIVSSQVGDAAAEDSQSFAGVLREPELVHTRRPHISHAANGRFAITEGSWKLVMPHHKNRAAGELYDLANDPSESHNVAAEHPQRVADLQQKITAIVCNGRTTPGTKQANDTGYWDDLTWLASEEYARATSD